MAMVAITAMVSNMNLNRNIHSVTEKHRVTVQQKGPANRPFLVTLWDFSPAMGARAAQGARR